MLTVGILITNEIQYHALILDGNAAIAHSNSQIGARLANDFLSGLSFPVSNVFLGKRELNIPKNNTKLFVKHAPAYFEFGGLHLNFYNLDYFDYTTASIFYNKKSVSPVNISNSIEIPMKVII